MIGRFHEFSVHAPDVLASIEFYEKLGFVQASTGEAWPYPYAVVTDGRIGIGLHRQELPASPLLAFVLPDLLRRLAALEAAGIEIVDRRLGGDEFNQAAIEAPGGLQLRLLEARTYSPVHRPPGATSKLGWFEQIALPVADAEGAARRWELLGFVPSGEAEEPLLHLGLTSDAVSLALLPAGAIAGPALVFTHAAMPERIRALRDAGLVFARRLPAGLDPERNALLLAPEGTQFLLTTSS
ncbi:MAG TPA: VOC family protein [Steroidobacteraceae bacterium]|nr:VOC family protein [Steroidobacteraceae bacterium]